MGTFVSGLLARVGLVFVLLLLVTGGLVRYGLLGSGIGLALAVVLGVGLLSIARSSSSDENAQRSDEPEDGNDKSGQVWDAIPSWQYTGRHVESGGLARDDQERALAEIEEEARKQDPDAFCD